jgi:hypothetical protein
VSRVRVRVRVNVFRKLFPNTIEKQNLQPKNTYPWNYNTILNTTKQQKGKNWLTKVLEKSEGESCLKNSEDFTHTTHNHYFRKKKSEREKKGEGGGARGGGVMPFTNTIMHKPNKDMRC